MKRWKRYAMTAALLISITPILWSQSGSVELDLRISRLDRAGAAELVDNRVLFTYAAAPGRRTRHVGIAFLHEDFRTVHTFYRLQEQSTGPASDGLFFLAYPLPQGKTETTVLEYRLVVDGIWMADPANPDGRITRDGVRISRFEVPSRQGAPAGPPVPVSIEQRLVRFVFEPAAPATGDLTSVQGRQTFFESDYSLDVRVAGSFNRWDPFSHQLREDPRRPGRYVAEVAVPPGRHNYYLVINGIRILDPHNSDTRYHREGYFVSTFLAP